jgi:hypothetical protein
MCRIHYYPRRALSFIISHARNKQIRKVKKKKRKKNNKKSQQQ